MRIQNLLKVNSKIKKSHTLLVGSLFIFMGVIALSWNYLAKMRDEVYSEMKISMMDKDIPQNIVADSTTENTPETNQGNNFYINA